MKYGVCTNQPSLCRRAAARDLMPMSDPDTRCPEPGCGKPLLPAPGGNTATGWKPSLGIIVVIIALLGGVAGGYYAYQQKNETHTSPDEKPKKSDSGAKEKQLPQALPIPVPKDHANEVSEIRPSREKCKQANWDLASCEVILQCWQPESPTLSSCEGLSPKGCKQIKRCLGVAPSDVGPGVKY